MVIAVACNQALYESEVCGDFDIIEIKKTSYHIKSKFFNENVVTSGLTSTRRFSI